MVAIYHICMINIFLNQEAFLFLFWYDAIAGMLCMWDEGNVSFKGSGSFKKLDVYP